MVLYSIETVQCRRKMILDYFGEDFKSFDCNGTCDNCINRNNYQHTKQINCYDLLTGLKQVFEIGQFIKKNPSLK